jgi:hypothetical protein
MLGDLDGCITEAEPHAGRLIADMAGGQPGDAGERLRVQQDEAARDAVGAVVAGAVQQVPGDRPPLVSSGQYGCLAGVARGGGDLDVAGVAACRAPLEEVAGQDWSWPDCHGGKDPACRAAFQPFEQRCRCGPGQCVGNWFKVGTHRLAGYRQHGPDLAGSRARAAEPVVVGLRGAISSRRCHR